VASFGAGGCVRNDRQPKWQCAPVREKAELGFNQANTAVQLGWTRGALTAEIRSRRANGAAMIDINMAVLRRK
jgi:hypothetical protein